MAISQTLSKKYNPNLKDINYLSKNFPEFRQNLIEFAKTYYPKTYTDFNEASPGMMFIEMAAYVGDVMSFYIDNQFKENLLTYANERRNVVAIAQSMGYKPRLTSSATVTATIFQIVPALGPNNNYDPDQRFFLKILKDSRFSSTTVPQRTFRSSEDVNFADPIDREIRVFSRFIDETPSSYVVSKKIKLISGDTKTARFDFGSATRFSRIEIPDNNVISILSIVDSDGNEWTEVDFLGQDLVLEEVDVSTISSGGTLESSSISMESSSPTKIATFRRKPRRFTTRVNPDLKMEIWFGSGDSNLIEDQVNIGTSEIANDKYSQLSSNFSIDPYDFLSSDTFGVSPSNTTLTVTYLVGGGIDSNVPSNTINRVNNAIVANRIEDYAIPERPLFLEVVNSISINNEEPATGGGDADTVEEIRQNALAFFNAQNRVVTDKDYLVRTLSLPSNFGNIAKAFVVRDEQINNILTQNEKDLVVNLDENPYNDRSFVPNPVAPNSINIYVLGYNANKNLTTLNSLVKENLSKYLEQFRMLTDEVNILDAFVVNIAVNFDIIVYRNYNMNDVVARCIDAVKEFFDITRWQINQPIILNDLRLLIGSTDGVQTVTSLTVKNKYKFKDGKDYQEYRYPINEATVNDIIYPSLDPCIFELRYPDSDIVGNARQ
jgi:hypothetical protein